MEARSLRSLVSAVSSFVVTVAFSTSLFAAGYRTTNFTVDAPTPQLAKEIGDAAEHFRSQLAMEWLGHRLPNWSKPCPIKAKVAPNLGAGGATSFIFDRGEVFGWQMEIQGSRERILDSVVPHEVTHTIFASHFREPIPRWADEGACTTVEHRSEIAKQETMLIQFMRERKAIPFSNLFGMTEYPPEVLPLYAEGHSLTSFLIAQRGKREFVAFLDDGLTTNDWIGAVNRRYGYRDLFVLQNSWQNWVVQGRPPLQLAADADTNLVLSASYDAPPAPGVRPVSAAVIRGQDPGSTPTPRTVAAGGIDGPLAQQPRGRADATSEWNAIGQETASIYDARVNGTVMR